MKLLKMKPSRAQASLSLVMLFSACALCMQHKRKVKWERRKSGQKKKGLSKLVEWVLGGETFDFATDQEEEGGREKEKYIYAKIRKKERERKGSFVKFVDDYHFITFNEDSFKFQNLMFVCVNIIFIKM